MGIKNILRPIDNFVKKIARNVLAKELAQIDFRHEQEIKSIIEDFRRHMQLLYSPTILISKSRDFFNERTITYSATFVVPENLRISTPKAEIAVTRELVERCPNEELLFMKDLTEKLFEDIKTRAKYIKN